MKTQRKNNRSLTDLAEEIEESRLKAELYPLSDYFEEEFFDTKYVVYIPQ